MCPVLVIGGVGAVPHSGHKLAPPGPPSPSAVETVTYWRHRGRDGQEPRPLREHCAYSRDGVDAEPPSVDLSGDRHGSKLSAHEPRSGWGRGGPAETLFQRDANLLGGLDQGA